MRAGLLLGLIFLFPFIHTSPIPTAEPNGTTPTSTPFEEYKARFMKWIVPEKSHIVFLETGQIHGPEAKVGNVSAIVFNSIPYAKPPTGERRFENPEPMDKWNDTKDTTMVIECWHMSDPTLPALNYSEDCLYLKTVIPVRVYKTMEEYNKRQPAVFWIHGGGFTYGSKENYELENIVKHFSSKGIVFIAPNYRLGALGFLSSWNNDSATGNYGLKDLILALKFVHENAEVLDVDVNQITLAGEGSGAALASLLAASPKTKGLFSSLILSSGTSLAKDSVRSDYTSTISRALFSRCCFLEVNNTKERFEGFEEGFIDLPGSNVDLKQCLKKNYKDIFALGSASLTPIVDGFRGNDSIISKWNITDLVLDNAHVPILLTGVPHEFYGSQEYLKKAINEETDPKSLPKQVDRVFRETVFHFIDYSKLKEKSIYEAYSLQKGKTIDIVQNLTLILTDMFAAAQYEEALNYAKKGMDVYYIRNNVRKLATEYTTSGMDTSLIFGNLESTELKPIAKDAEKWITSYVNILTEFIRTRKVSSLLPFTTNERNAYSVSNNGTEKFIYKSNNYNFWKSMWPPEF